MELTDQLLLDTHALLWVLLEPARIPAATLDRIRAAGTELFVSAASAWEIGTSSGWGSWTKPEPWSTAIPDT